LPYNGSGVFQLVAGNPVITGTVISSTWANNTLSDIANNGLTNALTKDGQQTPTANIPLGGFQLTGVGAGTTRTAAPNVGQIQDGAITTLGTIAGTDTITAASSPAITAYVAGQQFSFNATGANTTSAVTLNISTVGAKAVMKQGPSGLVQLAPGDLQTGQSIVVRYDGTQFIALSQLAPNTSQGLINKIINGDFDVWQRGASFTNAATSAAAYGPDCWQIYRISFATGYTATRNGTVPPGSRFALKVQRNAGDVNTQVINVSTSFESSDVIRWVGKTVTLSWSAFGNGAFNGTALTALAFFGTGVDGNAATGFTGSFGNVTTTQTLTGTYARGTMTFVVPATATQFAVGFSVTPTGTAGAADFFQIAQVQLNEGAVQPFEVRGYPVEFPLCTRYYRLLNSPKFFGYSAPTGPIGGGFTFPDMRAAPSVTFLGTPAYSNASGLSVDSVFSNVVNLFASVTALGSAFWAAGGDVALNASL
jgi:hypothetical protein